MEKVNATAGYIQKEIIASSTIVTCDPLIRPSCMVWVDLGDGNGLWQNYMNDFDYYAGAIAQTRTTPTVFMDGNVITINTYAQTIAEAKKAKIYARIYADG